MTSFRQIEANRGNALRSTGPKTEAGKRRSRRNAVRHGLTAETVVVGLEDIEDYRAFEAAVTVDYDARTAVQRELVLRLASLYCGASVVPPPLRLISFRSRPRSSATAGVTTTLATKSGRTRRASSPIAFPHRAFGPSQHLQLENGSNHVDQSDATDDQCDPLAVLDDSGDKSRKLTYCFLRLANLDNGVFERLGRYEAALWRQIVQTLFALQTVRHR